MLSNLVSWPRKNWKISLSVCFVLIAIVDTFFAKVSTVAATFLGLAALPWLIGLFDKLTLPGGVELDLRKLEQQLDQTETEVHDSDKEPFEFLDLRDPNLALAALRIEIEKRLRKIAQVRGLSQENRRLGIPQLIRTLEDERAIGRSAGAMIRDMLPAMNAAAHGMVVPETADDWVLQNGPKILSLLDEKY
ncbi:hypothetical protein J7426_02690 [Tropicibacter sp. R16_0]|uniref:hypothetical protein n=1 Tax=Tropicibacter sp. R16_0 TaxID=2821102 RepID=UPI001ADB9C8A|nr:hypothetical protein [Tropicibacter sp. R16_0]MBO9449148.1 hypothetical protein [Tropicibacter sp. R16_0]